MLPESLEDTCWFSKDVLPLTLLVKLKDVLKHVSSDHKFHREEVSIEGAEVCFSKTNWKVSGQQ